MVRQISWMDTMRTVFLGIEIMTRKEIQKYPDRIVGTVSCVPEYEEWGDGDRGPVKVNGRIWIKVK